LGKSAPHPGKETAEQTGEEPQPEWHAAVRRPPPPERPSTAAAAPASRTGGSRSADSNCWHTRFHHPGTILATACGRRLREGRGGVKRCLCTDTQRTTRTAEMEPNGREFAAWVMPTVRPASSYLAGWGRAPARDQHQPMTLSGNSGISLSATPSMPAAHRLGDNCEH